MNRVVHGPVPYTYPLEEYGPPLVLLEDEHGGRSIIGKDDGCFILRNEGNGSWHIVSHWYLEAALALRNYLNELETEGMVD